MMCQRNQKYYRTMAQIELWAVRRGCQEFRMRNHICGMDADISLRRERTETADTAYRVCHTDINLLMMRRQYINRMGCGR